MKPKDLLTPFQKGVQEKCPFFDQSEKILYLPARTPRPKLEVFEKALFSSESEICLEIGSGNGDWICEKAQQNPNQTWVALEMRFDRVRKIWSKMKNLNIDNLWIICAEAKDFLSHYVPRHALSLVAINFPDPWPKNKHAKNRLIQSEFVECLQKCVKEKGEIHIITDDPHYALQIQEVFSKQKALNPYFEYPYYSSRVEDYGFSYFMNLWAEKKRSFHLFKYENHVQNFSECVT